MAANVTNRFTICTYLRVVSSCQNKLIQSCYRYEIERAGLTNVAIPVQVTYLYLRPRHLKRGLEHLRQSCDELLCHGRSQKSPQHSAHKDYEPTKQIDSRMYDLWFITYYILFIMWMCVYIICKSRIHQNIVYHNESNVTRAIWYHLSFVQSRGLHWFWSIYADVVRCYNLQVAYIGLLHLVSCLEVCSSKLQTNPINEDCSMCISGSIEQVIK